MSSSFRLVFAYFGENETLGGDAQDERVLAIGELAGTIRALPSQIFLHQVDVVQCAVVKLGVGDERHVVRVVAGV